MGERVLSFAMVLNYYLKSDLLLPLMGCWHGRKSHGLTDLRLRRLLKKTGIQLNLDLAV